MSATSKKHVSAKQRLTLPRKKAKDGSKKKNRGESNNSNESTRQLQQRVAEREELASIQQQLRDKRFPSSNKMSSAKRLDRLEICTAQSLAVMDRLLEFWTLGQCPFTANSLDPNKPEPNGQPTTTVTEPAGKPEDNNNTGHNSSNSHSPYI